MSPFGKRFERVARSQVQERGCLRRERTIAKRGERVPNRNTGTKEQHPVVSKAQTPVNDRKSLNWGQQEYQLLAKVSRQPKIDRKANSTSSTSRHPRPIQNEPSAATTRPTLDRALEKRLGPPAENNSRWTTNLLSSGRSGSVSLSQKKQRDNNGAARMHKMTLAMCEEADRLIKPALTGNATISGLEKDRLVEAAFVGAETRAEVRNDPGLGCMDRDVVERVLADMIASLVLEGN